MAFNPEIHHRQSIRLRGYDYSSAGAYFVTICAWQRECLFGEVNGGVTELSPYGRIVLNAWQDLPRHYRHIELDEFVVMPNHVHGIIVLHDDDSAGCDVRAGLKPALTAAPTKRHGLPEIVRGLKTFSARRINQLRDNPGAPVWQRNYYERVIRDERELDGIRQYIADNPQRWAEDENHPARVLSIITTRT